jgi:TRAP-type uncharacterized transport system fused permease subunit
MFVYGSELLMVGSWPDIVLAFITSVIGVFLLAASVQGYFLKKAILWERIMLSVAALLLITPGIFTDLLGIAVGLLVLGSQLMRGRFSTGFQRR